MQKLGGRARRIVGAFQLSAAFLADDDRARFHQTNAVAEQFTALLWVEHRGDRTELDDRQRAGQRSEERRVGKESVSRGRSRWLQEHKNETIDGLMQVSIVDERNVASSGMPRRVSLL